MKSKLNEIIADEIKRFLIEIENMTNDDNDVNILDKYYEKNISNAPQIKSQEQKIDGKLIGFVETLWGQKTQPSPVYQNPKSLDGFDSMCRGVLTADENFYVARYKNAMHDDILEMLAEAGAIPYGKHINYSTNYPEEFVAVIRLGDGDEFHESSSYEKFPEYYQALFDAMNSKNLPYKFIYFG